MGNPVMNRFAVDVQEKRGFESDTAIQTASDPNVYSSRQTYGSQSAEMSQWGHSAQYGQPTEDMREFEYAYVQPAADAVDRGVMTYDDVIIRTSAMLGVLTIFGGISWFASFNFPLIASGMLFVGIFGGLGMAFYNSFTKNLTGIKVGIYAALEGLALGAISAMFEASYPGIVVQALVGTFAVFGVTLALFSSGKVRGSSKLLKFTLIAILGLLAFRLLSMPLAAFNIIPAGLDRIEIAGIPLGVFIGAAAVLLGAFSLIGDFESVRYGVEAGAPRQHSWYATFGLLVTIVWMYMEILRLLSYFRE